MLKSVPIIAAATVVIAACASQVAVVDTAEAAPPVETAAAETTSDPRGPALNGLTEVKPSDISPNFEKDTVIGLNAIVRRSLDVVEAYDALSLPGGDASIPLEADQFSALEDMQARAKAAVVDINAEARRLSTSGEVHNAAILAGMVEFVTDVESEISASLARAEVR
ncbi:MAG: hypothetical protein AAGK23_07915 [Pseudomonadota bacterium]